MGIYIRGVDTKSMLIKYGTYLNGEGPCPMNLKETVQSTLLRPFELKGPATSHTEARPMACRVSYTITIRFVPREYS